jgi:hypothetical protein
MNAILLAILLTAAAPEIEVLPLQGPSVTGNLIELTSEVVAIESAGQRVSFETGKLMAIAPKQKPAAAPPGPLALELVDGSTFTAQEFIVRDRKAQVNLGDKDTLDVPVRDIATVRFQAASETLSKEWTRILGLQSDTDLLVVRKADTLDYHKGLLGDITAATVNFDMDGDKVPLKRPNVFGLSYYHAGGRELPAAICLVSDNAGGRWSVCRLEMSSDKLLLITTTDLVIERPLERLTNLDFSRGKILYLSDLKPDTTRFTPYFGTEKEVPAITGFFAPRQDQNLEGKPLQLDGKQYSKGLAVHSRTELVYRLPGKFSRLKATAGIDDAVRPNGNVRLVIRGDDKVLLEETVAGKTPATLLDIDLDMTGVRRLGILVDFGEDMDVADHLDLCNARIIK